MTSARTPSSRLLRRARHAVERLTPEGRRRRAHTTRHSPPSSHAPYTLLNGGVARDVGPRVQHVAAFATQAGDVLLPVTVRDVFSRTLGDISWRGQSAHRVVGGREIRRMNAAAGVVIGGGGLFLRDTNPNQLSGWQWSCSVDALSRLTVPLVVFAVGYNRFRGQPDFDPVFREHVTRLTDQAVFVGLRNHGSMEALRHYLPADLHHKVRFQPCPTTVTGLLYGRAAEAPPDESGEAPFMVLNCAFDRPDLRFGERQDERMGELASRVARLSRHVRVKYYAHAPSDERMIPYLDQAGVRYEFVRLTARTPREVLDAYRRPIVAVGMRGHAQMIPFGCGRPIVSLATHDKLLFFLDDIDGRDWGVDLQDPDFGAPMEALIESMIDDPGPTVERIQAARQRLWDITQANVADVGTAFGIGKTRPG